MRVYGINKNDNEDCKKEVVKFAENKLGLQISRKDIDIAHRVGRKLRGKSRAMIVRFLSHEKKTSFMKVKRVLRDNNISDAGISEDLTILTKRVRDSLRKNNVRFGLEQVWTIDGKLKAKKSGSDMVINIDSVDSLKQIVGRIDEDFKFD